MQHIGNKGDVVPVSGPITTRLAKCELCTSPETYNAKKSKWRENAGLVPITRN